jgi:hypothetical protein
MSKKKDELNSTPADPIFTPSELYELIKFCAIHFLPILIVGSPGQGKTTIVTDVAKELDYDLILTHPVTDDPTDYKGYPSITKDKNGDITGATFLPFGNLKRLMNATKPTIHFADDLGPASKMVQAAYMQLVQGRQVNGHKIGENVVFMGATNRKQDKAAVQSIIEPLKSKYYAVVEITSNLKDFSTWYNAQKGWAPNPDKKAAIEKPMIWTDLPFEVLSWVRYQPAVLDEWEPTPDMSLTATPRGIEHVARMLLAGLPENLQLRTFAAAIGTARAMEFISFLRIYQNLPDPDEVLKDPKAAPIPSEPGYLYALCGALSHRANKDNIENLIAYADRLTEEFSVLLVKDAVERDWKGLCENDVFTQWITVHQDVLV